jgi:hypothetical protein
MRVAVLLLCVCSIFGFGASAGSAQRGSPDVYVYVAIFYSAHRGSTAFAIEVLPGEPLCPDGAECYLMDPSEVRRGQVATFTRT